MRTFSYWEKEYLVGKIDYAIIGSGIVGLNAAIFIKSKHPKSKVAIFEQGIFPSGATTRNAGFSCFGSPGELVSDLENTSNQNEVWETVEKRFKGLKLLLKTLGADAIGYQQTGGYEVYTQKTESQIQQVSNKLSELNHQIKFITGLDSTFTQTVAPTNLNNILYTNFNSLEGLINSGLLMKSLIEKSRELGVEYYPGFKLDSYEDNGKSIRLNFFEEEKFIVDSSKVLFCTNAFTQQLLPELDVVPGRGMIIVTEKLKNLPDVAAYHHNCGYDYFRVIDNRILIGGGRDLEKETEQTLNYESNPIIKAYLLSFLQNHIIETPFKIEYEWQGFMGFGENKNPVVKLINDRIGVAARLGGMGVAIGTHTAQEAANIISD